MNTHEIVALAIVAVRLAARKDRDRESIRNAVRAYRQARYEFNGYAPNELRDADRAVNAVERKLARF